MVSASRLFRGFTALASACAMQAQYTDVSDPAAACQALGNSLAIENATVQFAEYITAGTNISLTQDYNLSTCGYVTQMAPVDLCRVALYVSTSNRSGITLESWLPTNWTGRFLMTGTGGLSGCIHYDDIAYGASFGFASFAQNAGHNGTSGLAFYQNSDVVEDFVYRGMHVGVVVGKQITTTYYGTDYTKSYYFGCSTGGRQGFKSVQDFPEDFDGALIGAPAIDMAALTSWSGNFYPVFGNTTSASFVTSPQWTAVHAEVLKQCDGLDGALDGIIEDTELCPFRPEALQCAPGVTNSTTCLTSPQVAAVREAFTAYYGLDGKLIYPRLQPGAELTAQAVYFNGKLFSYTTDWMRYVVYNDSNWPATTFTRADAQAAISQNPFNVATWNGDLSPFQSRGGKVLHWHGQADPIITSDNSPRYYDHVSRTMSLPSSDLDDFYRFFRVTGTGHCTGGVGAHMVGQALDEVAGTDPQHNVLARIVAWVEDGDAPDTITGTKYVNDDPTQGIAFQRNHCRYPYRSTYVGPGNYTEPEAWTCV